MMGTAEELPQEPAQKPVFMEDMTEEQLASAVSMGFLLGEVLNSLKINPLPDDRIETNCRQHFKVHLK